MNENLNNVGNSEVPNPRKRKATKKGIALTAIIVIAIVGASFLVYFIP